MYEVPTYDYSSQISFSWNFNSSLQFSQILNLKDDWKYLDNTLFYPKITSYNIHDILDSIKHIISFKDAKLLILSNDVEEIKRLLVVFEVKYNNKDFETLMQSN